MYLTDGNEADCCGCTACAHACPVSAIAMTADEKGFAYPVIDSAACVHCDLCRRTCPLGTSLVGADADPAIHAVKNNDPDVVSKSSSGGVFSLLADHILGQKGVVYGVAFDAAFAVRHARAETREAAAAFRTSKYVESDPAEIYDRLQADLAAKRPVLLTGTPCQIAGATAWLKARNAPTDTLYTCDNICHGVPSRKVWADYLGVLRARIAPDDAIVSVNMRSKSASWKEQKFEVTLKKGDIDAVVSKMSFNKLFKSSLINRPSCFACRFTSYKRPADLTLGDFWNAESARLPFGFEGGVNEVLVNTPKGAALFEAVKKNARTHPISKKLAWQAHLEYSGKQPKGYGAFWTAYLSSATPAEKEALFRRHAKGSFVMRVIHFLSPVLRKTGLYNLAGQLYRVVFVRRKARVG